MPTARCEPLDAVLPTARGERGDETETAATVAAAGGATDRPRGAGQAVCVRSFAGAHRRGLRGAVRRDPAPDPGDPHGAAQVRLPSLRRLRRRTTTGGTGGSGAAGADPEGAGQRGVAGVHRHRQVLRRAAAVSPGTAVRADGTTVAGRASHPLGHSAFPRRTQEPRLPP